MNPNLPDQCSRATLEDYSQIDPTAAARRGIGIR